MHNKIQILWFNFWNDWLLNSRPLSVRIDPGVPKYVIQCLNIALMISELSLLGILTLTLYLVAWSIRWSTLLLLISLICMAIFLLKYDPNVNPTIGLGSVFLLQMCTSQEFGSTCKILINSGSLIPAFLTKSHNFILLGWLNCLCNFVAILIFSDLFFEEISLMKSMCLNFLLSSKGLVSDVVMSRRCASQWNFLFKHRNAVILKVDKSRLFSWSLCSREVEYQCWYWLWCLQWHMVE